MMRHSHLHITLLIATLITAHFLLTLAYSVWNPLGEAPDETDHWAYIVYLAKERTLPVGSRVTQSKHPPLYHGTAAFLASPVTPVFDYMRGNPDVSIQPVENWSPNFFVHTTLEEWPWQGGARAFHLARLWSVFISTAAVAAAVGLMRTAFPGRTALMVATVGLLAFLPEFAFVGASTGNDSAAALLGTLALWGGFAIYRGEGRWSAGWWTPLALGLGFLAKVSTATLWPVVALAIVMGAAESQRLAHEDESALSSWAGALIRSWRRWLVTGLAVFLPALLLISPWLLRNWQLYGDLLGMELARQTIDLRSETWTWHDTVWLLSGWFVSFWGKFGGAGHIPMPRWIYLCLAGLSIAGLAGLVRGWFDRRWRPYRPQITLLLLAWTSVAFGIWRYSLIALGTDQGRLLFPAVVPIVALFVLGLLAWIPNRATGSAAAIMVGLTLVLGIFALVGVILPAFSPPPLPAESELATLSQKEPVTFGELTLTGWDLSDKPVLYWQAQEKPNLDWRTDLRVVAEDGSLAWQWRRSPGYGRWSTDHWPPGTTLGDEYGVRWPDWAGPGRYGVEVALAPFGEDPVLPTRDGMPVAEPDHPFFFLGWLVR